MRVVLVTMDSHLASATQRATQTLIKAMPGLQVRIHAAAEFSGNPEALARCQADIGEGDIVIASMLFLEDHFLPLLPALKARRLARALISDMVVYHPAKRQDGLRDGTLKQLFEEEIRKSWEEYADQVGKGVADSTPYFKEALNEILAGGRQIF